MTPIWSLNEYVLLTQNVLGLPCHGGGGGVSYPRMSHLVAPLALPVINGQSLNDRNTDPMQKYD